MFFWDGILNHRVSRTGLQVVLEKVRVMLTLLPPTSVQEIRGFLGCVGYYRRLIDGYAKKAIPLSELLTLVEKNSDQINTKVLIFFVDLDMLISVLLNTKVLIF